MAGAGDDYAAWRSIRGTLGSYGDTVVWLSFQDGRVTRFVRGNVSSIGSLNLPRYFRSVRARATVLRFPWIQFGDLPYFFDTPQVIAATVSRPGFLFALRPYSYTWEPRPNRYVRRSGSWIPGEIGIEAYHPDGRLAVAMAAPEGAYDLEANGIGHLLVFAGDALKIYQDPTASPQQCAFFEGQVGPHIDTVP